ARCAKRSGGSGAGDAARRLPWVFDLRKPERRPSLAVRHRTQEVPETTRAARHAAAPTDGGEHEHERALRGRCIAHARAGGTGAPGPRTTVYGRPRSTLFALRR